MKKYHFSSKNVCKYMSEDFTIKDIDLHNMPIIELFGVEGKVIKELVEDDKANNMMCLMNKIQKKEQLGSGISGIVISACIKKDCDVEYATKMITTGISELNYLNFWNEVFVQTYFAFTGYAPRVIAAWTCLNKRKNFLYGHIIMEKVPHNEAILSVIVENKQRIINAVTELVTSMIVHNDLHYENILITTSGKVQIIDFGMAIVFNTKGKMLQRFLDSNKRTIYPFDKFSPTFDIMNYSIIRARNKKELSLIPKSNLIKYLTENKDKLNERYDDLIDDILIVVKYI